MALTWEEGYEECQAEGAHLVVVNSEAERQAVWQVMRSAPPASNARAHWFFFAGFRADSSRVFRTIFSEFFFVFKAFFVLGNKITRFYDPPLCGAV